MDLVSQAFPISLMIAAAFGLLSFLSPCVLPIVPPYLAFMSGVSMNNMREGNDRGTLMKAALFFVMGLSTVFLILAITVNRMAASFLQYQDVIAKASGVVIVIFGLHFLGLFRIGFLQREVRLNANSDQKSALSAYILGLAFAFGWSPCLGPALSAILSMIASEANLGRGLVLMLAYAIGLGLPFILAAIFVERFVKAGQNMRSWMPIVEKVMGILLVIVGVMMFMGSFTDFAFWLNSTFPILQKFG